MRMSQGKRRIIVLSSRTEDRRSEGSWKYRVKVPEKRLNPPVAGLVQHDVEEHHLSLWPEQFAPEERVHNNRERD